MNDSIAKAPVFRAHDYEGMDALPGRDIDRDAIRAEMKRCGVTQAQVAREFGVKQNTFSEWLAGLCRSRRLDIAVPAYCKGLKAGRES